MFRGEQLLPHLQMKTYDQKSKTHNGKGKEKSPSIGVASSPLETVKTFFSVMSGQSGRSKGSRNYRKTKSQNTSAGDLDHIPYNLTNSERRAGYVLELLGPDEH